MPTTIQNRYQVIQELGHGGMGAVYLVEDLLQDRRQVALKMLGAQALVDLTDERDLAQFKQEFNALRQLRHPNLVDVYDFFSSAGSENPEVFFTMEYVLGEDLQNRAQRLIQKQAQGKTVDLVWLYEITVQVCRALQYIHSRGFIHYDVKPRNIRITPEGQVKLMDFGLIGEARTVGSLKVRGTPDYIAPELLRGAAVDHRADLYSLGVTLYEIITGQLPFSDTTSSFNRLRQHLEVVPELPAKLGRHVPEGLKSLVVQLMAPEPDDRLQSANQVIQTINQLSGMSFPVETRATKSGYVQSGGFVGREFEMARLQGLMMRAMQGQGQLVLVTGGDGMGKTRLARELRHRAQMQRMLVCEGACREQVRAPYRPWIFIFSQLIAHYQAVNHPALATFAPDLARLMPALAGQLEEALGSQVVLGSKAARSKNTSRLALMHAAAQFLLATEQPLVIMIEDLQHADPETADLLEEMGRQAGHGRLLLVGLYNDDEIDTGHPLSHLLEDARLVSRQAETGGEAGAFDLLHLNPLEEAEVMELVQSMLVRNEFRRGVAPASAPLPPGLVPRLMAETGGNPLYIESLMHNLVEEDLLVWENEQWVIDLTNLSLPANIQEAAQRRLMTLDQPSLSLLQWAAVVGASLDLALLQAVSGLDSETLNHLVSRAAAQHVLIAGEMGVAHEQKTYRFSNDRMRLAVYNTLSALDHVERHRRVGEVLRKLYDENEIAEFLAWHFEQAGDYAQALHYLRFAAQQARSAFSIDSAIQHYTHALEMLAAHPYLKDVEGPAAKELPYELLAGREGCYHIAARRAEQQADLDAMALLAREIGDVQRQIHVVTRQAVLANLLGNHSRAQLAGEVGVELARQVGDPKLEADSLHALSNAYYHMGQLDACHDCLERALSLYVELKDRQGESNTRRHLGRVFLRQGKPALADEYNEEALKLSRAIDDLRGQADALNALAINMSDFARARSYHEQALAIRQSIGDMAGQAQSLNNLAVIHWNLGLYNRACENIEAAIKIERERKGRSALVDFLETMGRVYLDMGEYEQAQQALEQGLSLAQETGNPWIEGTYRMMIGRVFLEQNDPDRAEPLLQQAVSIHGELNSLEYATALVWLGAAKMLKNDIEAAYSATLKGVEKLRETGNAGDYSPQDVWWQHYLVLRRYQTLKRKKKTSTTAQISDAAWECLQQARTAVYNGIVTLSDEGLRRNYLNKVRANRDIITEWTRQARRRGASLDESLEGEHAGETSFGETSFGETSFERNEFRQAAEAGLAAQEKFKRVLAISVQMNETHDAELLLNYVMDQVTELSGAERSFLVLLDESGQMNFQVARGIALDELKGSKAQISYTLLGSVMQSRKPMLLQDAMTDERFGRQSSVLELNLRSVLCVPLLSRSELIGIIYADNRSVSGRFSQADVDLMVIFANQAATAIDNARLYQETVRANRELEAWARTLENRVEERTAELQAANQALERRAVQVMTSSQVAQQAISVLDLSELLSLVVERIQESFGYYYVGIWLLNDREDAVSLKAGRGRGRLRQMRVTEISLDMKSIIVSVCKSGHMRLVEDAQQSPDFMQSPELPLTRSELALPLRMGHMVYGALDIQSDQTSAFREDDRLALQTLADQIAIAIRNAQLYKSEQKRRELAESLEQAGRELSSNLDLYQVPGRVLDGLASVVPYARGAVIQQEAGELVFIARRGFPQTPEADHLRLRLRPGDVYDQVVKSGSPVRVGDVTQNPGWNQVPALEVHRSWMGVPLISKDQVKGILSLTRAPANAFTADDATLAATFAVQAAIALENASLYDEIRRFSEQLECMVQERTEELNQAYHTLERLDKVKSDFIEVAAHELRTPLTVIKGYTQVAQNLPALQENAMARPMIDGILSGVNRLHEIVNSMLDVSKIDSKTLDLRRELTPLGYILRRVYSELETAFQERDIECELRALNALPPVSIDAEMMYKVFAHLMSNAIKYTPDGGKVIVWGRCQTEGERQQVEVIVQDTGIGIAPQNQELIFEKFFQTGQVAFHSSGRFKYKGGGPGLGLAIARGIVEAHGGRIWVESPGYDESLCPGSSFHVLLNV